MKKLVIALLLCAVIAGLTVTPVMGAKSPKLTFTTDLLCDGNLCEGSFNGGFKVPTEGQAGYEFMHVLTLSDPVAVPGLKPHVQFPFYLKSNPVQQARLVSYFQAKNWPVEWFELICDEIEGESPFFYVEYKCGTCYLVDGFTGDDGVKIDDDYPEGNYFYTGTLIAKGVAEGVDGPTLDVTVTLKVRR